MPKASTGEELLGAILMQGSMAHLMELPNFDSMLNDHEQVAWEFIKAFASKHKILPGIETVEQETDVILPIAKEPPSYYAEHLRKRWVSEKVKEASATAKKLLPMSKEADPDAAFEAMQDVLMQVHQQSNTGKLFDARYLVEPVMKQHTMAAPGMYDGIEFGWPYLDKQVGGLRSGDLVSYVGRPSHGKTWQLLWGARHAWKKKDHEKSVMFVSMEMDPVQILTRLASLESGVENKVIKAGLMDDTEKQKIYALEGLENQAAPFWVVDGALSVTVQDIMLMARTLHPDVIYVDGAYLVRHPDSRLNMYQRVAIVCEQLKMDVAQGIGVPVVASWQFNREASKKKKDDKIGLEDIAYSDVIGQLSSIVLGLFEGEDLENQKRKRIDLLKGRGGEEGEFYTHWRFRAMKTGKKVKNEKGKLVDELKPGMDFSQWDPHSGVNVEDQHTLDDFSYGG